MANLSTVATDQEKSNLVPAYLGERLSTFSAAIGLTKDIIARAYRQRNQSAFCDDSSLSFTDTFRASDPDASSIFPSVVFICAPRETDGDQIDENLPESTTITFCHGFSKGVLMISGGIPMIMGVFVTNEGIVHTHLGDRLGYMDLNTFETKELKIIFDAMLTAVDAATNGLKE